MLESIVNSGIIYYVMGGIALCGVGSKLVVSMSLNGLVKAASNMSKSSHGFMRLVRAKFEHAHMVNDKVENIEVFVEKYIHEYKVLGICLYSWQRMEKVWATLVGAVLVLGVGLNYYFFGMGDAVIECFGIGSAIFVVLVVVYQLGDEKFKLQKMRVYMVDYLENVCGLRYCREHAQKEKIIIPSLNESEVQESEKDFGQQLEEQMLNIESKKDRRQRHLQRKQEQKDGKETRLGNKNQSPVTVEGNIEDTVYTAESHSPMSIKDIGEKSLEDPRVTLTMVEKLLLEEADRREEMRKKRQEEPLPNEAAIREILQEFMA